MFLDQDADPYTSSLSLWERAQIIFKECVGGKSSFIACLMTEEMLDSQILVYTANSAAEGIAQGNFNGILAAEHFSDISEFAALTNLKTLKAQQSNLQEITVSIHSSLLGRLLS